MRRLTLRLSLCLAFALPARAQFAVYVTSSNLHLSNTFSGTASTSTGTSVVTSPATSTYWASGVGGGISYNFLPLHVVSLGFDLRGSTKSGSNGADTGLFGVKLAVHPPLIRAKPYLQGSAGYLATRSVDTSSGTNTATSTTSASPTAGQIDSRQWLAYGVMGGVDYPVFPLIDLRAEAGYLRGKDVGNQIFGGAVAPSPGLFTLNFGAVLHF